MVVLKLDRLVLVTAKNFSSLKIARLLHTTSADWSSQAKERRSKPFPVLDGEVDVSSTEFKNNLLAAQDVATKYSEILEKSNAG